MKKVYLKAAEMIDAGETGRWCNSEFCPDMAIACVHPSSYFYYDKQRVAFRETFGAPRDLINSYDGGRIWFSKNQKIIALLFMHWISKDEENV